MNRKFREVGRHVDGHPPANRGLTAVQPPQETAKVVKPNRLRMSQDGSACKYSGVFPPFRNQRVGVVLHPLDGVIGQGQRRQIGALLRGPDSGPPAP